MCIFILRLFCLFSASDSGSFFSVSSKIRIKSKTPPKLPIWVCNKIFHCTVSFPNQMGFTINYKYKYWQRQVNKQTGGFIWWYFILPRKDLILKIYHNLLTTVNTRHYSSFWIEDMRILEVKILKVLIFLLECILCVHGKYEVGKKDFTEAAISRSLKKHLLRIFLDIFREMYLVE